MALSQITSINALILGDFMFILWYLSLIFSGARNQISPSFRHGWHKFKPCHMHQQSMNFYVKIRHFFFRTTIYLNLARWRAQILLNVYIYRTVLEVNFYLMQNLLY